MRTELELSHLIWPSGAELYFACDAACLIAIKQHPGS